MSDETDATMLSEGVAETPAGAWVGRVIDERYRVLDKLGEGGMGTVFLAEHLLLHKQVALKIIHATFEGHAEIAARFAREAMVSARIEHPNVVSALDYGTLEGGGAYLVMQLVRGETLRKRIDREGALPFRTACELLKQVSDAVAAAHAAGIVHRDLKPDNVVLEPGEGDTTHVKVLDFGIAHLRSNAQGTSQTGPAAPMTQLGVVMGTPGYMAPEQAVGQPIDERADIYALGAMSWEMIAGRPPFPGSTLTEIVTQQFATKPPPLPADAQCVPEQLSTLIAEMLAARAEDRPKSALEVRDRIQALLAGEAQAAAMRTSLLPMPGLWATPMRLALVAGALLALFLIWRAFSAHTPVGQPSATVEPSVETRQERAQDSAREARRGSRARSENTEEKERPPVVERGKESVKAAATRVRDGVKRLFR